MVTTWEKSREISKNKSAKIIRDRPIPTKLTVIVLLVVAVPALEGVVTQKHGVDRVLSTEILRRVDV